MAQSPKNRKKYRVRKGRVGIAVAVLVLIIGAVIFLCVRFGGNHKNTEQERETVDYDAVVPEGEFVQIQLEDCNMYVGNVLQLVCISNPASYGAGVIWSSSDPDVVYVDGKGKITVKSTGAAAITATYGVLSDSVIICGVDREQPVISDDLPVYDVEDNNIVVVQTPGSSEGVTEGHVNATEPDSPSDSKTSEGQDDTKSPEGQNETKPSGNESQETETENEAYNKISEAVHSAGFETYLDNTYIYREDGNYLGEVIVDENLTQIYIMTRTTAMDNAFKQVVKSVIPTEYEDVFARFVSAEEDQTFSADGMLVRIVAPVNGGHTQLIIYY